MARVVISVSYEANEEIEKIFEIVGKVTDVDVEKDQAVSEIQKIIQTAFDEGRKYQINNKDVSL